MSRRRRVRTIALWTGTTLCVLIAAAFVVSAWWRVRFPGWPSIYVASGAGAVTLEDRPRQLLKAHDYRLARWNGWGLVRSIRIAEDAGRISIGTYTVGVSVPLYASFLAVATPTLLVWRFVAKFPRGHCRRCGYNLTGLSEARCPECGAEFGGGKLR